MKKYDAILFDLDGTLLDTGPGIMRSAAYALSQFSITVEHKEYLRAFVGPPLSKTFPKFGIPEASVNDAIVCFRQLYNTEGKYELEVYPGIEQMLKGLKDKGYPLYVCTSKPEPVAKEVLKRSGIDVYFDIIAGASFDEKRENKKDVLMYLMEHLTCHNPILIGDTVYDVIGAVQCGIDAGAVAWGYGNVDEMMSEGAVFIAASPQDILGLF